MRIAVYGAGGIIGQHMRLCRPDGHEIRYYRRHADFLHCGCDITNPGEALDRWRPDVIINLAGENSPDAVEKCPSDSIAANVYAPARLAQWCDEHDAHYVHISTQAVFSGENPPYSASDAPDPINTYGQQKAEAERLVQQCKDWSILRATFVLGLRPLPFIGRKNPLEQMRDNPTGPQVTDRWFSPVMARDIAEAIWNCALTDKAGSIINFGMPNTVSRFDVAVNAGFSPTQASHNDFKGLAPRPMDTTYDNINWIFSPLPEGLRRELDMDDDAVEIALFLGITEEAAQSRLSRGFVENHHIVSEDFKQWSPQTDELLLDWYRDTESYIWELTAYHRDPGYNYAGICDGVATRLKGTEGEILCVGDGVGELTLRLRKAGLNAVYHDLKGSRTAEFAEFRFWRQLGKVGPTDESTGWEPHFKPQRYDAIVCLDFLEHVTDVPAWITALFGALRPGGVALFQNAFGLGSGPEGSIPMHLARNDRYVTEYTPLMADVGWRQIETSNWWERAA